MENVLKWGMMQMQAKKQCGCILIFKKVCDNISNISLYLYTHIIKYCNIYIHCYDCCIPVENKALCVW